MKKIHTSGVKFLIVLAMLLGVTQNLSAGNCSTKLFSVTIDSKLTIRDVIDNLADTCGLSVIVKDDAAKLRMNNNLYYVKLKNSTLKGFLNTVLKDNDLNYTLNGNKLTISYLITRTFRIHYISGHRKGVSTANVTIAGSEDSTNGVAGGGGANGNQSTSKTGIEIESTDEFQFWKTVEAEIQRILIGAADGSTHYTRSGDSWTGPDGKVWEYNPLSPIVNPEAGMVTVTGTDRQINRVARYVHELTKQIKSQVLIDIRILSVSFDDSTTTGVDWSQLYSLQNLTANTLLSAQTNVATYTFDTTEGITNFTGASTVADAVSTAMPSSAKILSLTGSTDVSEVVKFLSTQGDVKSVSSPRVMALNNQPALISVGQELFYKIKSSSTASSGGGAVAAEGEVVDSVFAGVLLDITPEIDSNGMITLKINPSISDTIDTVTTGAGARTIPPDLIKQQIASVIKVKDGEHAILGGLISTQTGFKDNHIPLLGDIPGLGALFKRQERINTVEELVFIITPHIVKNSKSVSLKDLGYSKLNEK
ncbi:pilus (MSHA type) biogenesis protein MshL [Sulfurovum sp. TSL1]|uniref:pilus (MSHA type) biogenesis protein MshL n=1 Tax=Sulfurovum sp. TSL1 TaxID=2826994 RepID=UPI001CC3D663|nr:pilus (MSHA type) biogenesis protein MshL [Sulfurovum sp. TSL1]GIT98202.1 pilus (MSHA type) biogenesis protein MshL [Sulfurovum sp. TSL1]